MITTNTGAKKLESSDNWREIFPNPGTGTAGAHNASVDAQDRIQAEVAPIINGKQCALGAASGDYVLLRNSTITGKSDGAYIATKAIPANTDIDSTYLGNAITGGISNSINNNLTALSDNYPTSSINFEITVPLFTNGSGARLARFAFPYMKTPVVTKIYKEGDVDVTSDFNITGQPSGMVYVYTWVTSYNTGDVIRIIFHF